MSCVNVKPTQPKHQPTLRTKVHMGLPATMIRKDFAPLVGYYHVGVYELSFTHAVTF